MNNFQQEIKEAFELWLINYNMTSSESERILQDISNYAKEVNENDYLMTLVVANLNKTFS